MLKDKSVAYQTTKEKGNKNCWGILLRWNCQYNNQIKFEEAFCPFLNKGIYQSDHFFKILAKMVMIRNIPLKQVYLSRPRILSSFVLFPEELGIYVCR